MGLFVIFCLSPALAVFLVIKLGLDMLSRFVERALKWMHRMIDLNSEI
jgi:hypothetical protein